MQAGQCRSCEKRPRFSTLPVFVPSLSRQNEQFELEKRLKNGSKRPRFSDLSIPSLSMLLSMPSTSTTASACEKNNTSQFKPSFKVCFVPSLSWQIVLSNERKRIAPHQKNGCGYVPLLPSAKQRRCHRRRCWSSTPVPAPAIRCMRFRPDIQTEWSPVSERSFVSTLKNGSIQRSSRFLTQMLHGGAGGTCCLHFTLGLLVLQVDTPAPTLVAPPVGKRKGKILEEGQAETQVILHKFKPLEYNQPYWIR